MSGLEAFYPVNLLSFREPCRLSSCRHNRTQQIRAEATFAVKPESDRCRLSANNQPETASSGFRVERHHHAGLA